MDELLRIFLTWQFMFFCLGIAAITFVFRKILEFTVLNNPKLPGNPKSRIWRELILPIAPVLLGAVAGFFAVQYPYPDGLVHSAYGRISFGLVAGLLSGLAYRVVIGLLKAKIAPEGQPADPTTDNVFMSKIRETINQPPAVPNTPESVEISTPEDSDK